MYWNLSVRERVLIVIHNIIELVQSLLSSDRTTSNQAADILMNLGKGLNEVNGYEYDVDTGFDIEKAD